MSFRTIAARITPPAFFFIVVIVVAQPPGLENASTRIAPGVTHLLLKRGEVTAETGDRWLINVLLIDPADAAIRLARAMDEVVGAETTSSLASRHGALAAINGGYFRVAGTYRGEPVGILMINGSVLSEPAPSRPALAISADGSRLAIVRPVVDAKLLLPGRSPVRIDGINRPREKDEVILFTREFHRTTLTDAGGIELIVRGGRLSQRIESRGSNPIPTDGVVISATGLGRDKLKGLRPGASIRYASKLTLSPGSGFKATAVIGGGPTLIVRGVIQTDFAGFNIASFVNTRHPRTAVGTRSDGTIAFVTVDGRQPRKSVGMTIPELAKLMKELGCSEALNLDGGGSTTMVIGGRAVNSVSDATGERPVSDALLVFPRHRLSR